MLCWPKFCANAVHFHCFPHAPETVSNLRLYKYFQEVFVQLFVLMNAFECSLGHPSQSVLGWQGPRGAAPRLARCLGGLGAEHPQGGGPRGTCGHQALCKFCTGMMPLGFLSREAMVWAPLLLKHLWWEAAAVFLRCVPARKGCRRYSCIIAST